MVLTCKKGFELQGLTILGLSATGFNILGIFQLEGTVNRLLTVSLMVFSIFRTFQLEGLIIQIQGVVF